MKLSIENTQCTPQLEVENIYAAYVKKEILRGVSLNVVRGEITFLHGGNGSGKSTLLKTIAGLLLPTKGRILFDGKDITRMSVHNRQKVGIGYLLQGGRIFPNLTVGENMAIALKHHRNGKTGSDVQPGSIFHDLREKINVRAGLLSGGQRQMLSIEMVLAQEPDLVLFDEPTGGLTHDLSVEILDHIARFVQKRNCGVLIVEQNVDAARKVCDRQLTLSEAKIVQTIFCERLDKKQP
ncbi:MAG TPA: ATP-binding cassette domain-containing protein [Desulfitobacteriaceae bacterium]|nr:ATP-binding cassette domain-containing protein [Desulfitobacteriaceae bacterium]